MHTPVHIYNCIKPCKTKCRDTIAHDFLCNTVRRCWGQYGIQTLSARKSALPWVASANGEQLFSEAWRREKDVLLMWRSLVCRTVYEEGSAEDRESCRLRVHTESLCLGKAENWARRIRSTIDSTPTSTLTFADPSSYEDWPCGNTDFVGKAELRGREHGGRPCSVSEPQVKSGLQESEEGRRNLDRQ